MKTKGWGRSRVRDFYDLSPIKNEFDHELDWNLVPDCLSKKCKIRQIHFNSSADFFNDIVIKNVVSTWKEWLLPLVSDLNDFDIMLYELKEFVKNILKE